MFFVLLPLKGSSWNSLFHTSISFKFVLHFLLKKHFCSFFSHILYLLYIIYISFIFDSLDVLFTSFTTSGVYSLHCFIDPLSPPSILHQLLCSFFTCCSLLFFFSPFFLHVLYCSWHLQSLWPTQFPTKSFFTFLFYVPPSPLCSPFLLSSASLLCFTWASLLRGTPKVSSADELKLFVVGGVKLFLSLSLSLMGLRSDTLSGPRVFTNTCKKKLLLCFKLNLRHGWTQQRQQWIESEADAAVWSCGAACRSTAVSHSDTSCWL